MSAHSRGRCARRPSTRDVFATPEGVSIWVVPSTQIAASDPQDADALFEPAKDKVYRHPTFYEIPDEVKNL
jgi:ring-1,2-phenylacetyl-CoA epoxidase subunit PaaB